MQIFNFLWYSEVCISDHIADTARGALLGQQEHASTVARRVRHRGGGRDELDGRHLADPRVLVRSILIGNVGI